MTSISRGLPVPRGAGGGGVYHACGVVRYGTHHVEVGLVWAAAKERLVVVRICDKLEPFAVWAVTCSKLDPGFYPSCGRTNKPIHTAHARAWGRQVGRETPLYDPAAGSALSTRLSSSPSIHHLPCPARTNMPFLVVGNEVVGRLRLARILGRRLKMDHRVHIYLFCQTLPIETAPTVDALGRHYFRRSRPNTQNQAMTMESRPTFAGHLLLYININIHQRRRPSSRPRARRPHRGRTCGDPCPPGPG
jgi:hypothetical protein